MSYYQPNMMYNNQAQLQRLQKMRDDITEQIGQLTQMGQPVPQIQQTFITPQTQSNTEIQARWVDNYEGVKAATVYTPTLFMDRSKSKFYLKGAEGDIKSFEFCEVEELDEKDLKIRELENKIKELEEAKKNEQPVDEPIRRSRGKSSTTNANGEAETK